MVLRSFALVVLLGCSPKVEPSEATTPRSFDEDLPREAASATGAATVPDEPARLEAPRGKGLRTGTIARASLVATLDAGPGNFLRQLEVTPEKRGETFVGWQLVQFLDARTPLADADLVPGDVLLAINHQPLSRPDQLQSLWDSLRTANELTAQLWRGSAKFELSFKIDPPIAAPKTASAE